MCIWGDVVHTELLIPAKIIRTGKARMKKVGIDRCIYPLIRGLEKFKNCLWVFRSETSIKFKSITIRHT